MTTTHPVPPRSLLLPDNPPRPAPRRPTSASPHHFPTDRPRPTPTPSPPLLPDDPNQTFPASLQPVPTPLPESFRPIASRPFPLRQARPIRATTDPATPPNPTDLPSPALPGCGPPRLHPYPSRRPIPTPSDLPCPLAPSQLCPTTQRNSDND